MSPCTRAPRYRRIIGGPGRFAEKNPKNFGTGPFSDFFLLFFIGVQMGSMAGESHATIAGIRACWFRIHCIERKNMQKYNVNSCENL